MRGLTSILLSLPVLALAGSHHLHRRHHIWTRDNSTAYRSKYNMVDDFSGADFFDNFDFFTQPDPTHGSVNYLSRKDAQNKGLAVIQDDGSAQIAVDDSTTLASGQSRDSVRITSKKAYNGGLFTFDVAGMPYGCSLWPALWMVGPDWPNNGEIDIIEGVNQMTANQITLHTGPSCEVSLDNPGNVLGSFGNPTCTSANGANTGCFFTPTGDNSFGANFNAQGGGVYAMDWQPDFIKIWFFPRAVVPQNIYDKQPDPSTWGPPTAMFSSGDKCTIGDHFHDNRIVINTTLCGDWAGGAFAAGGCPGTCADFLADPSHYKNAKWYIKSIRVYQS